MMNNKTIGFIGFGLIGGSIAHGIKEHFPNSILIAYNYSNKKNNNLLLAKDDGILDEIYTDFDKCFSNCDIIFLCAPVLVNISYLPKLKSIIKPTCILTDVGSVKGNIYDAIKLHQLDANFIGGHPMAGSEKTGYENASSLLLSNAYYILTPSEKISDTLTETMSNLVSVIGAIPVILDAKKHDDITAAISHVPHIIAAELVNMVKQEDDIQNRMHALAAGGFKDITRIASSSPFMWQNICLTNTDSILKFLHIFKENLETIMGKLQEKEEHFLLDFFETAKNYRDTLPTKSTGMIEKIYECYIDITDETGAIATIATILAKNDISIKNIGIIHNREFEEGVLRIELYDEIASQKAIELLKQYNYIIYIR